MSERILSVFYDGCIRAGFAIIFCFFMFIVLYKYKPFDFTKPYLNYSNEEIARLQKLEKRVLSISRVVVSVLLIGAIVSAVPCVIDSVAINRQEYYYVTGQVVSVIDISDENSPDTLIVLNPENGKEMRFRAFLDGRDIVEGDTIVVTYLVGTKYAVVRKPL